MTTVSVVIAYRDLGDVHRRASFDYVLAWYLRLGWEIVVEAGREGAFSRAAAINAAVKNASGRVIVQSDPDSLVSEEHLRAAVVAAAHQDGLVIPHDRYLYLSEAVTADVLAGRRVLEDGQLGPDDCHDSGPNGSGNVVVFSRTTWKRVGGFDERFGMYGGDDMVFATEADALVAPTRRLAGDVVHLYHPRLPQSYPGHPMYTEMFSIVGAYRDALAAGPEAVRALARARRAEATR